MKWQLCSSKGYWRDGCCKLTGGVDDVWIKVEAAAAKISSVVVIGEGDHLGAILTGFCGDEGGGIGRGKV